MAGIGEWFWILSDYFSIQYYLFRSYCFSWASMVVVDLVHSTCLKSMAAMPNKLKPKHSFFTNKNIMIKKRIRHLSWTADDKFKNICGLTVRPAGKEGLEYMLMDERNLHQTFIIHNIREIHFSPLSFLADRRTEITRKKGIASLLKSLFSLQRSLLTKHRSNYRSWLI